MSNETPTPRVLIVEDEDNIRRIARKSLEKKYTVEEAADGWEAIQKTEQTYDLIILDIMMPGLSGHTAFSALDSDYNNASIETAQAPPTLLLTALPKSDQRVSELLEKNNVAGYLQKPFTPSSLIQCVDEILAG